MTKITKCLLASIIVSTLPVVAHAADLDDNSIVIKRTHKEEVYRDYIPSVATQRKVTTRTCVDDGDGITCHYRRYTTR